MINLNMNVGRVIAAFDFDVTITEKDTFVPFLVRAFGFARVFGTFLLLAPDGIKVFLGFSNRDKFKKLLIQKLFIGQSISVLQEAGRLHANAILKWVRPAALRRIEWHKNRGDHLVLVSASLDLYLEYIAEELGFNDLLCTRPSHINGIFDGNIVGENCRGPEKVNQLISKYGRLDKFDLFAYGDSDGDREMLQASNHAFFRAFELQGKLY